MSQDAFRTALLDPDRAVPAGLVDPQGRPAGRRFDVYRNNVAVSLTEALRTAFPVLEKLVGAEFFAAMAGVFLRAHPPASPLLMVYGAEMPGFLATFEPVAHLGYLPDIARIELALRESYHAADAGPVAAGRLQGLGAEDLLSARAVFAPAVRLIRSDWPVHTIWSANSRGTPPPDRRRAEDVLIARPAYDPEPHLLPEGGGAVVARLMAGERFGPALGDAKGVDLTALLTLLLSTGALADIEPEPAR